MNKYRSNMSVRGFTLIELIVVIVIVGILSALGGQFIVAPITGYVDLSRRARLVDQAELALRRMQRDVRHALPNSIDRISEMEIRMINTVDGGRYRRYVAADASGDILDFTAIDNSFDVLGSLRDAPTPDHYVVVYNVSSGDTGNRRKVVAGSTNDHILLTAIGDPSDQFPQPSPYQRFFIIDYKITYKCEGNALNRYEAEVSEVGIGASSLVARGIKECEFTYDPGATQRAGLVTMKLTLEEQGERITLLHQVHVVNAP